MTTEQKEQAEKVKLFLDANPRGVSRTDLYRRVFRSHIKAGDLEVILEEVAAKGWGHPAGKGNAGRASMWAPGPAVAEGGAQEAVEGLAPKGDAFKGTYLARQVTEAFATLEWYSGKIRVVGTAQDPWFVGADVAGVCGFEDATNAFRGVPASAKGLCLIQTLRGGPQEMLTVNLNGLVTMSLRSDAPRMEAFRVWATQQIINIMQGKPTCLPTGDASPVQGLPSGLDQGGFAGMAFASVMQEIHRGFKAIAETITSTANALLGVQRDMQGLGKKQDADVQQLRTEMKTEVASVRGEAVQAAIQAVKEMTAGPVGDDAATRFVIESVQRVINRKQGKRKETAPESLFLFPGLDQDNVHPFTRVMDVDKYARDVLNDTVKRVIYGLCGGKHLDNEVHAAKAREQWHVVDNRLGCHTEDHPSFTLKQCMCALDALFLHYQHTAYKQAYAELKDLQRSMMSRQ